MITEVLQFLVSSRNNHMKSQISYGTFFKTPLREKNSLNREFLRVKLLHETSKISN